MFWFHCLRLRPGIWALLQVPQVISTCSQSQGPVAQAIATAISKTNDKGGNCSNHIQMNNDDNRGFSRVSHVTWLSLHYNPMRKWLESLLHLKHTSNRGAKSLGSFHSHPGREWWSPEGPRQPGCKAVLWVTLRHLPTLGPLGSPQPSSWPAHTDGSANANRPPLTSLCSHSFHVPNSLPISHPLLCVVHLSLFRLWLRAGKNPEADPFPCPNVQGALCTSLTSPPPLSPAHSASATCPPSCPKGMPSSLLLQGPAICSPPWNAPSTDPSGPD